MDWKWVSIAFFVLGIICMPVWPYSAHWRLYPTVFCFFVAMLMLLISIFAKRGSTVWKQNGQG